MDPDDIARPARVLLPPGFFAPAYLGMVLAFLQDVDRWQLQSDQREIVRSEELRRRRDEVLRRLHPSEVFAAGSALLTGPDGRPDPRPAEVAVIASELVVLDADPEHVEDEIVRIPRSEIVNVRLLDEHGEPVARPPTEVEELDGLERRFVVWLDREIDGESGGHAFVFLSWSVAAEAERDFRRQLPA